MPRRKSGEIIVVTGRSQSGKSTAVSRLLNGKRHVLVYDPKGLPADYPRQIRTPSPRVLVDQLMQSTRGVSCRLVDPRRRYFDIFCRAAMAYGVKHNGLWVVADELAAVTSPGKAPEAWHVLCSQGKGYGITIIAITQRPAESDKTCFGNADRFVAFHSPRKKDRQYMAEEMDISPSQIAGLPDYHCIEKRHGRPAIHITPRN